MRAAAVIAGLAIATWAATLSVLAHDPITTSVSWDREIAAIIEARCISCHAPEGPAPMSLATYTEARPWARAIREEVLARRMPKWPVVRGYGDFINDPSLSPFEIALITAWVDGGAPESIIRRGQRLPPRRSAPLPAPAIPDSARRVPLPCDAASLPGGRLLGLEPALAPGGSMEVIVRSADGHEEPALWLRDHDPAFAGTYWLRRPIELGGAAGITIAATPADDRCRLVLHYAR